MAVAKRRQSKARRDSRRAQWMKIQNPASVSCPHCGEVKLSHQVCMNCGKYGPAQKPRSVFQKTQKSTSSKQEQ